jgi:hypothetical protein
MKETKNLCRPPSPTSFSPIVTFCPRSRMKSPQRHDRTHLTTSTIFLQLQSKKPLTTIFLSFINFIAKMRKKKFWQRNQPSLPSDPLPLYASYIIQCFFILSSQFAFSFSACLGAELGEENRDGYQTIAYLIVGRGLFSFPPLSDN